MRRQEEGGQGREPHEQKQKVQRPERHSLSQGEVLVQKQWEVSAMGLLC